MNSNKNIIILNKIIKYCNDSNKYAVDKSYEEFISDERSFVFSIFCLSQIGELVTILDNSIINKYDKIPWSALKSIRNRIVHNYDSVQYNIIWNIIQNEIKEVIIELQNIINDIEKNNI